jgi:hypothetical protein
MSDFARLDAEGMATIRAYLLSEEHWLAMRDALVCYPEPPDGVSDDAEATAWAADAARRVMEATLTLDGREFGTELALDFSLCPVHFRDYAICFDDEDEECAQVRAVHPCHDT